jgi:hypothetical protein
MNAQEMIANLLENWKSTAANALTLVVLTGAYFSAIPSESITNMGITPKEIAWFTAASGLAKMYVALITKDAK